MKKICILFCCLLLGGWQARGQDTLQRWQARFPFLHLISPNYPVFQIGGQYQFSHRGAVGVEVGIPCDLRVRGEWSDLDDKPNLKYWKLRSEIKYYYRNPKTFYLSIEHTHIPQKYERFRGRYVPIVRTHINEGYAFDKAQVKHKLNVFALKWGWESRSKKGFLIEYYVGGGVRIHNIIYSDIENQRTVAVGRRWRFLSDIVTDNALEGRQVKTHFSLGIKIGYIF